jgi:putative membrane protein
MLEALQMSLNATAVLGFLFYIVVAVVLLALFQFIYTRITPHKEFLLIREGNTAAAVALAGAVIGFALPVASVISHAVSLLDFVVWAVIAAVVQLLAFLAVSMVLKGLPDRIHRGDMAAGIYVAAIAVSVGLLNAACMTPSTL